MLEQIPEIFKAFRQPKDLNTAEIYLCSTTVKLALFSILYYMLERKLRYLEVIPWAYQAVVKQLNTDSWYSTPNLCRHLHENKTGYGSTV